MKYKFKEPKQIDLLEEKIKEENKMWGYRRLAFQLTLTILVVYSLFGKIFGIATVEGASMEPALYSKDIVIFTRVNRDYKKGDVILFHSKTGDELIKRVVALEGDTIDIDDKKGVVLINGEEEVNPHIYVSTYKSKDGISLPMTLEKDQILALGDNRILSIDSRDNEIGIITKKQVLGKISFLIFRKGY